MRKAAAVFCLAALAAAQLFASSARPSASQAILKLLNSRAAGNARDFAEAAEVVAEEAAKGKALHQFVIALVSRDPRAPKAARIDAATREKYLDESRDRIKALAEKGNSMSWYLLSLENNDPVFLKRAAEAGNVQAMNAWGTYSMEQAFASRSMSKSDIDRAVERSFVYFRDAAEKGDANGLYNLGMCYLNGWGVKKNRDKAFNHFRAAASLGHSEAINNIGGLYRDGISVERDYAIATSWFKKSADMGNPYGQLNYGLALQRGEGVEKDEKKAYSMFQAAVAGGSEEAMNALGMCFYNGVGVEKDRKMAVGWFARASKAGVAAAMDNLAECYASGTGGLKRDQTQATVWKIRARAANGDRNAAAWLSQNGYSVR